MIVSTKLKARKVESKNIRKTGIFERILRRLRAKAKSCPLNPFSQKYSRLRYLLLVKGLVICFYLGWSGSILQFGHNIIKVGSKSWLLTCSSNITLTLAWPSPPGTFHILIGNFLHFVIRFLN